MIRVAGHASADHEPAFASGAPVGLGVRVGNWLRKWLQFSSLHEVTLERPARTQRPRSFQGSSLRSTCQPSDETLPQREFSLITRACLLRCKNDTTTGA